jgi:hypothetical protein
MKPGLSVEQCVARLKRYHYAFKRLHQIFTARITAEPIYELKTAFSLHAWLCAEHVQALRTRVAEMREPPLGLDAAPDSNLEMLFDEILCSQTTAELLIGLYKVALPALNDALQSHIRASNPLADHPSVRLCRFTSLEIEQMIDFGRRSIEVLVDPATESAAAPWVALLNDCMSAAGGIDGAAPGNGATPLRNYSSRPFSFDPVPRRDERFIDPLNRRVHPETLLYDPSMPASAKVLMLYYKRLREIDVPEMMASVITQTAGKPWAYYRDMSRQLWDEARHAMMGEVGFNSLGIDWRRIPISWVWSLHLNTKLQPIERHAVLHTIEQGLMSRTGKRYEWDVAVAAEEPLAALFQDYDWADEVLHASIGRAWYVSQFPDARQATEFGQRVWDEVAREWSRTYDRDLLTQHNWWPQVYREACEHWGIEPEARVLEYDSTKGSTPGDLHRVAASA